MRWMARWEGYQLGFVGKHSRLRWRIEFWRACIIAGLLALLAMVATDCGTATPTQMAPSAEPELTSGVSLATPIQTTPPAGSEHAGGEGVATPAQMTPSAEPEPASDVGVATPIQTTPPAGSEHAGGEGVATPAQMTPSAEPEPASDVGVATPTRAALSTDGKWVLKLLDGRPLLEETFLHLILDGDQLGGFDGCNEFQSQPVDGPIIAQTDGSFTTPVKEILATQRGCHTPEGTMEQAEAYMSALREARRFRAAGDRLEIIDAADLVRLVLVKQHPLPGYPADLVGTEWRLLPEGDGEELGTASLAFLNDDLVAGSTACRDYIAEYSRFEGRLSFASRPTIGSSQSCSEDLLQSEDAFLTLLWTAEEYSVVEEEGRKRLHVRTFRGKVAVFEALLAATGEIVDSEWSLTAFVPLRFMHRRLDGTEVWDLRDIVDVLLETEVTASFGRSGISGSSGCNSYTALATVEDGVITIDVQSLSRTEEVCEDPDGLMEQEDRFLDLLPRVKRYGTYGEGLFLQTDDEVFLLFEAR